MVHLLVTFYHCFYFPLTFFSFQVVHYRPDMESRYGATFRKEPGRCPICSAALLQDFVCYMKHLAVEHKVVMAFVERDLEAPKLREEEECRKKEEEHKNVEEVEKEEKVENEFSAKSGNTTV